MNNPFERSTNLALDIVGHLLYYYESGQVSTQNVVEGLYRLLDGKVPGVGYNSQTIGLVKQAFREIGFYNV